MKLVAFAATVAACVGVACAASAADRSLKDFPDYEIYPPAMWSGFYIGGHVGGASTDTSVSDTYTYINYDPHKTTDLGKTGLMSGVQVGYNVQKKTALYGIEADLGYLNVSNDASAHLQDNGTGSLACDGTGTQQCKLDAKYSISGGLYGDVTGRLGYVNEKTLLYMKGGAAFLNVDVDANYKGYNHWTGTKPFDFSAGETLWGWTLGAGVEYALTSKVSIKAEYQHFDFGSMKLDYYKQITTCCGGSGTATLSGAAETDVTVDAVSVGLNYHLNRDEGALK